MTEIWQGINLIRILHTAKQYFVSYVLGSPSFEPVRWTNILKGVLTIPPNIR
jgi:hypothetical protein